MISIRFLSLVRHSIPNSRTKDKVVIITGANSPIGIGRASAHLFAANGAKAIFICDLNPEHLETHKRELASLYPNVEVHPREMDAGEEADVQRVVDEALKIYGRLDVFFANAGITVNQKRVLESSADDFMDVMKINALRYRIHYFSLSDGGTDEGPTAVSFLPSNMARVECSRQALRSLIPVVPSLQQRHVRACDRTPVPQTTPPRKRR